MTSLSDGTETAGVRVEPPDRVANVRISLRPGCARRMGEIQMQDLDPRSVANYCRVEAGVTDSAELRAALLSLARAIDSASAQKLGSDTSCDMSGKNGIVFSNKDGQVWVGWTTSAECLELGPADEVIAMMRDFLAQTEVGERLMSRPATRRPREGDKARSA